METPEHETAADPVLTSPTVVAEFIIRPGILPRYCHPEVEQFRDYVDKILDEKTYLGIDGTDQEVPFICEEALREYWTEDRIKAVLDRDPGRDARWDSDCYVKEIQRNCLLTFSILCYIDFSDYFGYFRYGVGLNDDLLPLRPDKPRADLCVWPWDSVLVDSLDHAFEMFRRAQWVFCPIGLDTTTIMQWEALPTEHILSAVYRTPTVPDDELGTGYYKASLLPLCKGGTLGPVESLEVVIKTLGPEDRNLWQNEVTAYTLLRGRMPDCRRPSLGGPRFPPSSESYTPFKCMVRPIGTFSRSPPVTRTLLGDPVHRGSATSWSPGTVDKPHVIILEDAPGGTLATFCRNHADLVTSSKLEDRLNLWHQMFHLIDALDMLFAHRG